MPAHVPKDTDFEGRVRRSFARQGVMETIGAVMTQVAPGEVEIAMPVSAQVGQQHGFVHAGIVATIADSACGYAALTLMPAGTGVLTAEFKINLMAPAAGERLIARGTVVRSGRLLSVAQAEVAAEGDGQRKTVALMTATLVNVEGRDGIAD
ncbi:PaaI family thioesterase [Chelatococcus sp. SYSU_G07232]|uniref:Medium/long-chain acyl-CoA thioesterase YigI n=1 Tax=Chelatococcus albus TaxID=3047466 RepID=A0ABT7AL38_9HYPH|nr:PaaI family thioesterase [Chelatococcus sp. SYSU_G07232]MDJ1159790.1 PaaI family thioesterase [Chelatococcus sp. SYSU_G07232]